MSLLVRIEEGDLDPNLDQVSDGENYKAVIGGCEDYVPGKKESGSQNGCEA